MKFLHAAALLPFLPASFAANVFYQAYQGQNPGGDTSGCTGGRAGGAAIQNGPGEGGCVPVGQAACVTLAQHTGDAATCVVELFADTACTNNLNQPQVFTNDGDWANVNFAGYEAVCGGSEK